MVKGMSLEELLITSELFSFNLLGQIVCYDDDEGYLTVQSLFINRELICLSVECLRFCY